ncbi:MAG: FAD-dependent oxidoreductase [Nitrospirae bacterium]|nr:FAD-dependent oxidoreductase [Nitrospirota bacterium]
MSSNPRRIAIIGAGPTGLEAALAAAEAGLPFTLYEAGPTTAAFMRMWGHVRLFSPWDLDVSPRARRALLEAGHDVPSGDDCPTGEELADAIFEPLAKLPGLEESIRFRNPVLAVSREGLLKNEEIGTPLRAQHPFRLLLTDSKGREWTEQAEIVLDCTGNYGTPNSLGDGGIPAPGEESLEDVILRWVPNFAIQESAWAGKEILLVGAGPSAQTAAVELAGLADRYPGTRILWAVRRSEPIWVIQENDPLPERKRLIRKAQEIANGGSDAVEMIAGVVVDSLTRNGKRIGVTFRDSGGGLRDVEVDRVLSLTGFVGDHQLYRQLQIHECYATCGPMKLAASLLASGSDADCLTQTGQGIETLTNPEPDFYILGSKSYGRNSSFLMRLGWQQVDEVFDWLASNP